MNKNKIIKGSILLFISVGLLITYFITHGLFTNEFTKKELYLVICDGFLIPTVINLGFAGLKFAAYQGTFDSLAFGVKSFFHLRKLSKNFDNSENLGDYVVRKSETRTLNIFFELIFGLSYLTICILFLILYKIA